MGVFASTDSDESTGHEQVVFCQDRQTGLRAIIGIYSTALGPGAGRHPVLPVRQRGRRPRTTCWTCPAAMAYKNALAGLDLGGGKAVIWGDPERDQDRGAAARVRAVRASRSAAATTPPATSAPTCRTWTWSPARPGSSPAAASSTAAPATRRSSPRGASSRACGPRPSTPGARRRCAGRRVGIAGLGKVGKHLTGHLLDDGAAVVATDVSERALAWARADVPPGRPRRRHRRADPLGHRRVRAVRARRRARRRHRAGAARQDRGRRRRTTSSPTPASRSCSTSAASSTRPTTWSTPAA